MGGQYGQNLITDAAKKRDLQKAQTFTLPDLSRYMGIDASQSSGETNPTVIPYLSHGIGVDPAQFSGSPVRPDDRAGARPSVPTAVSTPVSSPTGDGFNWGSAGIGAAGLAALALVIGFLVVLGRHSHHEGVAAS